VGRREGAVEAVGRHDGGPQRGEGQHGQQAVAETRTWQGRRKPHPGQRPRPGHRVDEFVRLLVRADAETRVGTVRVAVGQDVDVRLGRPGAATRRRRRSLAASTAVLQSEDKKCKILILFPKLFL